MSEESRFSQWIPLLGLLVLSGCVTMTPTDPYRPAPVPVSHAPQATDHGPAASAPRELDSLRLEEAIAIALEHNPEIAAGGYDTQAAQAQEDMARGAMLPAVRVEGAYTQHLDDQRLVPARFNGELGAFSDSVYSGDLVLRLPLFTGGRLINEARAAELLRQAADHHLGRTRGELVFNVSSTFYGILAHEKLMESLALSREALVSHLKRVNDLIAAQKAAQVDRLRTEVRLADVQEKIVREKNTLAVQKQLLLNLMGVEPTSRTWTIHGALDAMATSPLPMEEALAAAFANRPDYLAARKELEALARRVDVARAGQAPEVSAFGAYGRRWAGGDARPWGVDASEDVGRAGVLVDIPLFEGGRVEARIRQEKARLLAAQERLRRLELQIQLDVETALLNINSSAERVAAVEKAVEQAMESLRIEREKYDLGKGAIVDVLDAQAALLESQTNYYRALAEYHISIAQSALARGEQ